MCMLSSQSLHVRLAVQRHQAPSVLHKITLPECDLLLHDTLHLMLVQSKRNDDLFCLHCTTSEYHMLSQLCLHLEEVVPFHMLLPYRASDQHDRRDRAVLNRHISRLRRKLPSYLGIRNTRQKGYCLTYVS